MNFPNTVISEFRKLSHGKKSNVRSFSLLAYNPLAPSYIPFKSDKNRFCFTYKCWWFSLWVFLVHWIQLTKFFKKKKRQVCIMCFFDNFSSSKGRAGRSQIAYFFLTLLFLTVSKQAVNFGLPFSHLALSAQRQIIDKIFFSLLYSNHA